MLSGVAVERGETEEGGGLGAAEGAEFGPVSAEAGGVTGPQPGIDWMLASRRESPASAAMRPPAAVAVGLEGLARGAGAAGGLGVEFGAELAERAELLEELAAEGEQVAEELEVVRLGRGGFQAVEGNRSSGP